MASSTSDFAVETCVDLLDGEAAATWTNTTPEVHKLHDLTPRARENNSDDAVYVWSPAETNFERFSADGDNLLQDDTVEIVVATLDETRTARLIEDVVDVMGQYIDDNETDTTFHSVEPSAAADDRAETVVRSTQHFTGTVTVSTDAFRTAGP